MGGVSGGGGWGGGWAKPLGFPRFRRELWTFAWKQLVHEEVYWKDLNSGCTLCTRILVSLEEVF